MSGRPPFPADGDVPPVAEAAHDAAGSAADPTVADETAPAETAPAETAPAETAPAETAPAETAPDGAAPDGAATDEGPVAGTGDRADDEPDAGATADPGADPDVDGGGPDPDDAGEDGGPAHPDEPADRGDDEHPDDEHPDDERPDDEHPDDLELVTAAAVPPAGSAAPTPDDAGPDDAGPDDAAPDEPDPDEVAPDEPAPPVRSGPVWRDPADDARARLRRALVPRLSRSQLIAAAVCAVLGFAAAVQVNQAKVQELSSLRQSDLITVLDNVTQETARLDDQAAALRQTLDQLRSSSDNAPAAREAAQSRLDTLGVLAGTLPATGPGIELEITDPQAAVQANDLLETVQELRDAGAEAMQIGPVRIVARTAFVDVGGGMLVDKQLVRPPYRLLVIGDPQTLSAALEIPGGVLEVLRGRGGQGTVRTSQSVTVSALLPQRTPQYARPAASAAP